MEKSSGAGKPKINWPKSNSKEWPNLDEDLSALYNMIYSPPERPAESYPKVIYEMCKERFSIKKPSIVKKQPAGPSKRQRKCMQLREGINRLKQAYKKAPPEKEANDELQMELKKLRPKKRAESLKQNRKKFSSN